MDRGKYNCVDYGHGGGAIKKIRTVRKAGDEEENVGSSSSRRAGESASTVTNNRIPPAPPPPMISKMRNPPPPPKISFQRDKEPLKRPHRDDNDRDRPGPSRCHKLPRLESRDERGDKNHHHHHRRSNHNPEPSRNNNNKEVFQVPLPDCPLPSTIDVMDSQSEASNSPNPDCLPSSPDDETDLLIVTDAIVTIPANLANRSSKAQQPAPKSKSHLGLAGPLLARLRGPKQRPSLNYKNRNNSSSSNGNNKRSDGQSGQRRSCDSRKSSTDSEKSLEEARRRGEEHQRRRSNDEVRGGKNNEKSPPKSSQQSAPILITPGISSQKNNPPGNPSPKDCGSKGVENLKKFLASNSNAKENLSQALLRVTAAQAKAVAEKTSDLNKTTQQSETSSRPQSSQWIVITPQTSKGAAPTPTNLSPAKGSITVAHKVSPVKSSPIPTELAPKVSSAPPQKISPAKSSPTLVEKVSPPKGLPTLAQKVSLIPAEGGATKVSPTAAAEKAGPWKTSPTAAEKASPTAPEKASPTAPEKASLTAPEKASLTAPEKASPTAPDKSSPAKSLAAPSVSPRPTGPPEAPKTRNLSSSSESDEIQPKISLVPLAAITRKIPPDTTKIPRGNLDALASKTTNNQAGAVLTSKTKTGSQVRKTLLDEVFAREVESARAKLSSKEPAFASNDDLLNTLLGACDDDEFSRDERSVVKTTEVIPGLDLVCNDQPNADADSLLIATSSCLQNSPTCSVEEGDVTTSPTAPALDVNEMSSKISEGPDPSNQGPATRLLESVETMAEKPCCEESIPELVDEGPEKIANISPAACAKLKVNLLINTREKKDLALPIPSSVNQQTDNEADETEADMSTENLQVSTSSAPRGTDVTENSLASLQAQADPMIMNVNIVSVSIPTVAAAEDSIAEGPVRCSEDEQGLTCEASGQDQTRNEISKETPSESASIPSENQTESMSIPNENQTGTGSIPMETPKEIVSVPNENQTEIVSNPNATHTEIPNENQTEIVSNPNATHTEIPNEKEACNDCPSSSNDKSAPVQDQEQLGHGASSIEDENGEEFSGEEHSVVSINSVSTIEDNLAGQSRAEITQNESCSTTLEQSEAEGDEAQANESDSVSNEQGPVGTNNSAGIREDTTIALVEPIGMSEVMREVGQVMTNLSDAPPLTETIPAEPMEVEESSETLEENSMTTKDSGAAGESTPLLTPPASSEALPKVELNFRFRGEADDENVFVIDDDNEPENEVENRVVISDNPNDGETASTSQANNETREVGSIENYPILQILQEHKSGTDVGIQVDLLSDQSLRIRTDLFDPTAATIIDPDDQIPVSEQVNSAARKVKLDFFRSIALLCNKFSKVIEKAGGDSTDEVAKLEDVLARMRVLTDRQYCHLDYIEIILSDLRKKAAGAGESSSDTTKITDPLESVDPIELITVEDLSLYFHSLLLIDSVPIRKSSSLQELIYHQRYRICRLMFYFLRSNIALQEAYGMNICNMLYSKVKSDQEEISWTTENVVKCWDAVRLFSGELDVRAIQLDHKRIGASGFFKQAKTLVKKMKAENAAGSEGVGQPQQHLQQNQQQQQNFQQNQQQQQILQQNQQHQQNLQQNQQQQQNLQQNFQQQQIVQQTTVPMPQNTPPARGNLVGSHSPMSPSVAGGTLDVEVIHVQGAASPQDRCQVVQYQQQAQQLQQQRQQQMTLQQQQQHVQQQQQQQHVQQQQQQQHVQQQQQHVQQQQQQQQHVQQQQQQHVPQQQQQHVPQQQQQHVQQQNLQHHQVLRNQLLQRHELQRRGSNENSYQYPQNIQQQTQQNGLAQMLMSPGQQQQFSVRRQTPQMAQRQQQQLYPQYSQQQQQQQVQLRQQHPQVQLQQQQPVQLTQQQQVHLQQQQQQVQLQQLQQVQLQQQQQAQLQQQQVQYQQLAPEQQILAQQLLLNQQQQQQVLSQQQQQMGFTQQQQHHRQYSPAMHRATVGVTPRQPPAQTIQVAQSVHHQIRPQSSPTDQRGTSPQMIPDQRTCQSFSVQQQQHRPNSRGTPVLQSTPVPYQAISSPISPPVAPGQFNSRRRTPGVQQNFVAENNNNNVSSLSTSSSAASTSAIRVDIGGTVGTTLYVAYSRSNAVQNLVQSTQQQQQQQQSTPPILQQSTPPILQQTAGVQQQRRSSSSGIGLVANNNNVYEEQQEQENPSVLPSIDDDLIFPML